MKKLACWLLAVSLLLSNVSAWATEEGGENTPEVIQEETQSPENTPEATEVPSATETPEPAATETPEPPVDQPTEAPVVTETPVPDDTQAPDVQDATEQPTAEPEWDEVWMYQGEEQTIVCGKLLDVVQSLEEPTEVFLRTDEVIELKDVNVLRFLLLDLKLDEQYFVEGRWVLCVSEQDPLDAEAEAPTEFDPEDYAEALPEDVITLYVWAALLPDETPTPDATETPDPDATETPTPDATETPDPSATETPILLQVDAENYVEDGWGCEVPVFHLSGITEEMENYAYAAIIFDERFVVLSEDSYTAMEPGVYTLRLVILDDMYDIVSASENYTLYLDFTPPMLSVDADMENAYTAYLTAADGESGLVGISLDGGVTWIDLPEEGMYTLSAKEKTTFPAGTFQAKDLAGNVTVFEQEVVLDKISWGGGGGGGNSQPPKQHAPATHQDETAYNAVGLQMSEDAMHTLVMEDEELELTLDVTAAQDLVLPDDYEAKFVARLDSWTYRRLDEEGNEQLLRDEQVRDVLILDAQIDAECEKYSLCWQINGAVLRKLFNSGINYLVFKAGDDLVTLPTQGFTAGTRYTELKMAGVSTKRFNYVISMDVDHTEREETADAEETERPLWRFTDNCLIAIQVSVDDETWQLSLDEEGEMYAENVYVGPSVMLEVPYGEFKIEEEVQ